MAIWRQFGWSWDRLGRDNALGAILTKDGRFARWNLQEFLATGRADVERFIHTLNELAPATPRTRALDFGCGVGRVTRALADHFDEVTGVDVAPSMIEQAMAVTPACTRCRFVLNRTPDLERFESASFPVVYSRLVLQHIKPTFIRRYIPELVRVLAPGGVLMFQLPGEMVAVDALKMFQDAPIVGGPMKQRLPKPIVRLWRWCKYKVIVKRSGQLIEMFGLSRDEVMGLVESAGGTVLAERPDHSHGIAGVPGYEYWITKAPQDVRTVA